MAVTNYHTVDGEIIGETTGGVRTDYMTDALGSVIGTTVAGAVQNTYRYKPYGGLLAKTGTAADPKFQWNGGSGYRATGRAHSDQYVRSRHYGSADGAWTATDMNWPGQRAIAYCWGRPTLIRDPSGAMAATPVNVSSWNSCCCNGFSSFIEWTNVPVQVSGYVIQYIHVSITGIQGPCGTHWPDTTIDYYEAWPVSKTTGVQCCLSTNWDDDWAWSPDDDYGFKAGNYSVKGIAIYVEGTPRNFAGNFAPYAVPNAGCLLSTWNWPEFTWYEIQMIQSGTQPVDQQLSYSFNCCCSCKTKSCSMSISRSPSLPFNFHDDCPTGTCPSGCNPKK